MCVCNRGWEFDKFVQKINAQLIFNSHVSCWKTFEKFIFLPLTTSVYSFAIFLLNYTHTGSSFFNVLFFRKKKKTDKFFCDWIAQAENFLPLNCYFQSLFLRKQHRRRRRCCWKKAAAQQQQFIVFSSLSLYIAFDKKKILCWEGKWVFFRMYSSTQRKKITEYKNG